MSGRDSNIIGEEKSYHLVIFEIYHLEVPPQSEL